MLKTGVYHNLKIQRIISHGAYLNTDGGIPDDDVLLPIGQLPAGASVGDEIEVFVYMDSEDRVISTVNRPKLALGECGYLTVAQTTRIGAFLDWGLEKDLFLPFDNQRGKIHSGDELFVGVIHDRKDRLCATMGIYDMLTSDSPYKLNDRVSGIVYSISDKIGALVAIDNRYHGLIPRREVIEGISIGDRISARISNVRPDGKLILSVREKSYKEMDTDGEKIMFELRKNKGRLSYGDKTSPNLIKKRFGMSKSAFKKAAGRLMKKGLIKITDNSITLIKDSLK